MLSVPEPGLWQKLVRIFAIDDISAFENRKRLGLDLPQRLQPGDRIRPLKRFLTNGVIFKIGDQTPPDFEVDNRAELRGRRRQ